jgi:hypothetical protein
VIRLRQSISNLRPVRQWIEGPAVVPARGARLLVSMHSVLCVQVGAQHGQRELNRDRLATLRLPILLVSAMLGHS